MLAALALVLFGCSTVFAQDCYRVYPTDWHFLNPDNTTVSTQRRGLLLAELENSTELWSLLPGFEPYNEICNTTRWERSEAEDYFDSDLIQQFPCFFYEEDEYWACGNNGSRCTMHVFLECIEDVPPEPDFEPVSAGLYRYNSETEEVEEGSEGLLLVHFVDRNDDSNGISGTACDDYFNDHAADLVCKSMGYNSAAAWGSDPENSRYIPDSLLEEHDVPILVDDVRCEGYETHISECYGKYNEGHDCSRYENLWLSCSNSNDTDPTPRPEPDHDWVLAEGALLRLGENGEVESGSEGLLLVHFVDRNSDGEYWRGGTVCDDAFNDHAADLVCQALGYGAAEAWGSNPENFEYIPLDLLEQAGVEIIVDDIRCNDTATNITDCEARLFEHNCAHSENLWLRCAGGNNQWEIQSGHLIQYDPEIDDYKESNEGLLAVHLSNRYEGAVVGTVCDDYFNDHAANLACQGMGYQYVEEWGSGYRFVPEDELRRHNVSIVIDDVQCDEWADHIMECESKIMEHNCAHSEDLWLRCGPAKDDGDDGDDGDDEEEGYGGIQLNFGGANVNLKLNKISVKRWLGL